MSDEFPDSMANIMVVDDEKPILELFTEVLSRKHSVKGWTNYDEALEHFISHPYHFDMALLDLNIGRKRGDDLANLMRQRNPDMKIAIITAQNAYTNPRYIVRYKPMRVGELTTLVEKELKDASTPRDYISHQASSYKKY